LAVNLTYEKYIMDKLMIGKIIMSKLTTNTIIMEKLMIIKLIMGRPTKN